MSAEQIIRSWTPTREGEDLHHQSVISRWLGMHCASIGLHNMAEAYNANADIADDLNDKLKNINN